MSPKIVVISNQTVNQNELQTFFSKEGFEVFFFSEITQKTLELISNISANIILIEMDKDGHDGIDLCYQLKMEKKLTAYVVINCSLPEDYIQIEAFKAGADDYIIKPISNRLLIKKIKALINRSTYYPKKCIIPLIKFENIFIDREQYSIIKGTEKISLPKKEFELLCLLFNAPEKTFSRKEIYGTIWDNLESYNPRIIDVHISKIRDKIGCHVIKTIRGVGYQLA